MSPSHHKFNSQQFWQIAYSENSKAQGLTKTTHRLNASRVFHVSLFEHKKFYSQWIKSIRQRIGDCAFTRNSISPRQVFQSIDKFFQLVFWKSGENQSKLLKGRWKLLDAIKNLSVPTICLYMTNNSLNKIIHFFYIQQLDLFGLVPPPNYALVF